METDLETFLAKENPSNDLSFHVFSLSTEVLRALDEMGYLTPTPVQQAVFQSVVDRLDLIVQSRTGTGKTAAFALPIIDKLVSDEPKVQVLVLAPTRELAIQNAKEIHLIGKYKNVKTTTVYGGAPMERQIREIKKGAQIVSGTPGRVLDHLNRGTLDLSQLSVLVLDEMDEMLSMGFARELNAILERLPSKRQTLCFSATVEEAIQRTAEKYMNRPEFVSLSSDTISPREIAHYVYMVSGKNRVGDLISILEVEDPESAIVFCNLRSETERVAQELTQAGFSADWLNGDLPQGEREKVMARTRKGELRYLVATDVAARGIDISHITHIINYSFPESVVSYIHRTGRTGRAGRIGTAISLVSAKELGSLYYLRLEYKISPIERSLPTKGELQTRKEMDRIDLLNQAFGNTSNNEDISLARRILTHPNAERILGGLLRAFLGVRGVDIDEEAAAARRARQPTPAVQDSIDSSRRTRPHRNAQTTSASTRSERVKTERELGSESQQRSDLCEIIDEKAKDDRIERDQFGTLYLNLGKKDGLRIGELARFLREACELSRNDLGRIRIRDKYTLVGVPRERLDAIVDKLEGMRFNDKQLAPERAKVG
ncbi:MAG: DEAD/DEAH box helicase [Deltaproteobacteria bacterium]|nr:DEAD/DEAH box helicase [Deltaproteobacteria bacterium]